MAEETQEGVAQASADGTFVVTDKREQRRREAEERKAAEEAARAAQEEQLQRQIDEIRAAHDRGELTDEQRDQLLQAQAQMAALQDQQPPEGAKKVATAFVVYLRHDGSAGIATNIEDLKMDDLAHVANPNETYTAMSFVMMDMQAQQAANHVRVGMQMVAQQMQAMQGGGQPVVAFGGPNGMRPPGV